MPKFSSSGKSQPFLQDKNVPEIIISRKNTKDILDIMQFLNWTQNYAFVAKEKYAAENKVQIQKFKNLFNNAERTAYCPDSKANYS